MTIYGYYTLDTAIKRIAELEKHIAELMEKLRQMQPPPPDPRVIVMPEEFRHGARQ